MSNTLMTQLDVIKDQLREHNHSYYILDDPRVPDAEYDRLMQQLLTIEKDNPQWVTADSPSQRVGDKPDKTVSELISLAYSICSI